MGHLPLLCRESPLITVERNGPLPFPLLLSRAERLLTIAVQHALSHRNIQKLAKKGNKALVICFVSILILLFGWQNCRSIIMFAVLIGCCGVSCGMVWPMLMGMANSRAQGLYGRVSGLMTMGSGIGGALWPIVFGKLMDVGGIRNSLWMLIATGGVAILILIVQRRQV